MNRGSPGHPVDRSADFPGPGAQNWQPTRVVAAGAGAVAAAAVGWAALAAGMDQVVAAAVAVVAIAVLLFTARRRLTAGPSGVAVRGVLSTRRWLWSDVDAVALATQQRLGLTSTTVELDLGDEVLVFGRFELDADPQAVHDALLRWYTA